MKTIALILVIVGGINWGLYGVLGLDLVKTLFGDMSVASKLIYVLIGISAVYMIFTNKITKK